MSNDEFIFIDINDLGIYNTVHDEEIKTEVKEEALYPDGIEKDSLSQIERDFIEEYICLQSKPTLDQILKAIS